MKKRIISLIMSASVLLSAVVTVFGADGAESDPMADSDDLEISDAQGTLELYTNITPKDGTEIPDAKFVFEILSSDGGEGVAVYEIIGEDEDTISGEGELPLTLTLRTGERAVVTLDAGEYEVLTECDSEGFECEDYKQTVNVAENDTAEVIAEYTYKVDAREAVGELVVSVEIDGLAPEQPDKFYFEISGDKETTAEYTVYDADGEEIDTYECKLPDEFTLYGGWYAIFLLPAGEEYTVTQVKHAYYDTEELEKTVAVAEKDISEAVFVNTYNTPMGKLSVSVSTEYPKGYDNSEDDAFMFELAGGIGDEAVEYSICDELGVELEHGKEKLPLFFELMDGHTLYVELPARAEYTVIQEDNPRFGIVDPSRKLVVNPDKGEELTFKNVFIEPVGILEIRTDISYPDIPEIPYDDVFTFTVNGDTYRESVGYVLLDARGDKVESGSLKLGTEIELRADLYIQLELPADTEYTVTQAAHPDYETEDRNITVAVEEGGNAQAIFVSDYIEPMGILLVGVNVEYPDGPEKPVGDRFNILVDGESYKEILNYTICDADNTEHSSGVTALPADFDLADGQYVTLELPAGIEYTVVQKVHSDYDIVDSAKTAEVIKNGEVEVYFLNSYIEPLGTLKLSASVTEPDGVEAPDDTFIFGIYGETYRDFINYTVYSSDGRRLESYTVGIDVIIELKRDEYALVELTPGSYRITQSEIDDYIITENAYVNVFKDGVYDVVMANEYVEPLGKLKIERDGLGEKESFIFTVNGIDDGNSFVSLTVILPVGEDSVTVCGLPKGEYEVASVGEWSVRYTATVNDGEGASVMWFEIEANEDVKTAVYSFAYNENVHWLMGEAYLEKRYYNN